MAVRLKSVLLVPLSAILPIQIARAILLKSTSSGAGFTGVVVHAAKGIVKVSAASFLMSTGAPFARWGNSTYLNSASHPRWLHARLHHSKSRLQKRVCLCGCSNPVLLGCQKSDPLCQRLFRDIESSFLHERCTSYLAGLTILALQYREFCGCIYL